MRTIDGDVCEFTATSANRTGKESVRGVRVNSPALRKPKNPTQHTAHNRSLTYWLRLESCERMVAITCMMFAVIGRRVRLGDVAEARLMPLSVYWRRGHSVLARGGSPASIWKWCIAARYVENDAGLMPDLERKATNRQLRDR